MPRYSASLLLIVTPPEESTFNELILDLTVLTRLKVSYQLNRVSSWILDKSGILFISQRLHSLVAAQSDDRLSNKHTHSHHVTDKQTPTHTWTLWACFAVYKCLEWTDDTAERAAEKALGLFPFISTAKVVLYRDKACTTLQAQSPFCGIILLLWPQWGGLMGLSPLKGPHFLSWGAPTPRDVKRSQKRLSVWRLIVGSLVGFSCSSVCKPKYNPLFNNCSHSWKLGLHQEANPGAFSLPRICGASHYNVLMEENMSISLQSYPGYCHCVCWVFIP